MIDSYETHECSELETVFRTEMYEKHRTLMERLYEQAKEAARTGTSTIRLERDLTEEEILCCAVHYIYPRNGFIILNTHATKRMLSAVKSNYQETWSGLPWDA